MRTIGAILTLTAVAVGCTMNDAASGEPPTAVGAFATFAPVSPQQMPATVLPTSSETPAPTPFMPFTVTTWADNVLLRSNPGYLFPQLAILSKGTSLLVLGRSPGAEWLLCETSDSRAGWVFTQLVERAAGDLTGVPTIWPSSAQALVGKVNDQAGVPISGIQFSIIQGAAADAPRNDAVTDDSGTFYAFMPSDVSGTWLVSYTAVSCKSNTMDANCNCKSGVCGSPDPESNGVIFPRSADDPLEFIWR